METQQASVQVAPTPINHWVMDIETTVELFGAVFEHYAKNNNTVYEFIIHELQNDLPQLLAFLDQNIALDEWHINFNGIRFDAQVIQYILNHRNLLLLKDTRSCIADIYRYAQSVIEKSNRGEWPDYAEWHLKIKQIDIFKMNHWDSGAKNCSLKWVQYSTDWLNMEEMPLKHDYPIKTWAEIRLTMDYCRNDTSSTKHAFHICMEQVGLRKKLTETYGINLYSASEPRISKELFAHFLAPKMGIDKKVLKGLRTPRDIIRVNDIILPYIKFRTKEFILMETWFRGMSIRNLNQISKAEKKKLYTYSMSYKGCITDYGLGGLHGIRPGHHKAKPGFIIMTSDVTSFYPNLAIRNRWSPAHIPADIFCPQYEWFFDERKVIPKKDPINYVYKIILNATYGLSGDENSYLYDPELTMRITVNGQLSLSMLYEMLAERIPDVQPLMQNTDGLEMMIPEQYKDLYMQICAEWEQMTLLQLEHDQYRELMAPDVNNYIAITTKGETKEKGRFEWKDQDKKKTVALHKNKSFLVIPKAIYAYYVDGTLPEVFLKNHKNIFDYCAGAKVKGSWVFESTQVTKDNASKFANFTFKEKAEYLINNGWEQSWGADNWVKSNAANKEANTGIPTDSAFNIVIQKENGTITHQLPKIIRYYMTNNHPDRVKVAKRNREDGRIGQLEATKTQQVIANKIDPNKKFEDYDIDMGYYLNAIYKEIRNMDKTIYRSNVKQLQMF